MKNPYIHILENQLATDYDCTPEEVHSSQNIFRPLKTDTDARPIGAADSLLKIAVYREKLLVMADPVIMDWCQKTFAGRSGTWLSEPAGLIRIHQKLQEHGQRLADTHHHYIPSPDHSLIPSGFDVKWYENDQLEIFRGDERFGEALLFDAKCPDMLAVCAVEGDTILGMASVTRDCPQLWQIGVDVTNEGRGKGIGTYVTILLKEEVLKRGIVPTYATAESHIKSQKVAFQAGFEPAFYELFSLK